ncbi:MAG: hypothetical protein HYU58_01340 [Proteobacteria bacterium]|nr:hypothetical protein [Pseudomonadota bacterium]
MQIRHYLLGTAFLLTACSLPYRTPTIDPDDKSIVGLAADFGTIDNVDVLLVHGMCSHGYKDWVKPTNANLVKAIETSLGVTSWPIETEPEATRIDLVNGGEYYKKVYRFGTTRLTTHAIVWSPVTKPFKKALCYDVEDKTRAASCTKDDGEYSYDRVAINSALKDILLNDCLADAVIYAGKAGGRIQATLADGLQRVFDASDNNDPLFLISESLGSKMLFDTVMKLGPARDQLSTAEATKRTVLAAELVPRLVELFMGANQMPLLALAENADPDFATEGMTPSTEGDSLEAFARLYQKMKDERLNNLALTPDQKRIKLHVTAFSDPNDLLSYPLRDKDKNKMDALSYAVTDVIVSNSPGILGVLENPLEAHQGYRSNPEVLSIIACGTKPNSPCK